MLEIIIYIIVAILIIAGILGSILPVLPGPPLVLGGILLFGFFEKFEKINEKIIVILVLLTVIAWSVDFLASALGVKKAQGSKSATIGSVLGGILGFVATGLNVVGLIVGTFVGAFMGELVFAESGGKKALKVGIMSLLGFLAGVFMKLTISIIMVIIFIMTILS